MRILGISHIDSGCGYHRVVLPLGFMDDIEGYVTNIPMQEVLERGWDIFLFNRVSPFDKDLSMVHKELNAKIIVDMDDDWLLPQSHIAYSTYQVLKTRLESNMRHADMVTCTNERIAERIYPLNNNVHIIPNALPFGVDQFTDDKIESEQIRIFWCGSITHEKDLELLRYPLFRLPKNNIQMVIGGYNASNKLSKETWDRMVNYYTASRSINYEILNGVLPNEYMAMYKHADIMLIPLEKSAWHSAKSNLKILEAACKRVPVIVSNVEPYSRDTDAPVLWVNKQTDWIKHIRYLTENKQARIDYGNKLFEWAKEKYNLYEVNKTRRQLFASITTA